MVENLIAATKAGTEPLRRYHRLRKRVLGLDSYHTYDTAIPLVDFDRKYPYEDVQEWLPASVAPLGADYQRHMRDALASRWIDVYENPGKRSGAYSAPVYGVHPYMLLNYNDTLDAVFTLAHEMGHSMHTILSNAHQPFVYSAYTIFIAEVPSTLSEMLFLDHMLARATDDRERIVLLQHAIDGIVGTFYTQVLFADYELQAHRLVEEGRPVTADGLSEIYFNLLQSYYGDAMDYDEESRITWSRIPHFYSTPYYVLSVRDLLRVERAADAAADDRIRCGSRRGDQSLVPCWLHQSSCCPDGQDPSWPPSPSTCTRVATPSGTPDREGRPRRWPCPGSARRRRRRRRCCSSWTTSTSTAPRWQRPCQAGLTELSGRPILALALLRDPAASAKLAALVERVDERGDGHCDLGPLDADGVRGIVQLYAGEATAEVRWNRWPAPPAACPPASTRSSATGPATR